MLECRKGACHALTREIGIPEMAELTDIVVINIGNMSIYRKADFKVTTLDIAIISE